MEAIVEYAQTNIVLLLFLIVGLGNLVGKLKIGSIALGSTTGILVVGILIGMLHFDVPPIIKAVFFTLYLFALGTKIGPGFVNVLTSKASIKYLVMCLSTVVLMAVSVFFVAKAFDLNAVVVGGLSAGAMTTSAILAASQGALVSGGVPLPDGMSASDASNMLASSYAITYLYGTFGLIILVKIAPMLIRKDVAAEAAKLDTAGGGEVDLGNRGGSIRAFRMTLDKYVGKSVADMEATAAEREADKGLPTLVEKVIRDGELLDVTPDLVFQSGDVIALWATPGILVFGTETIGEEVTDSSVLRISLMSAELVVTSKELEGTTLLDLVREHGRGVTIERMARNGEDQPIRADIKLIRGDVLFVSGPTRQVEAFEKIVGYVVTDQLETDLVNVGIFLAVFGALGTITVTAFGISLSLLGGASIGAMLGGAILGWLRSRSPRLGTIAAPAADALCNIGLGLFISAVAIGAGGSIVSVIQSLGPKLILAGVIVTTTCTLGTFLFGHFIMRLNVAENAGTTCGCMTGVAIGEVMKDAKSSVPAIGYALPSALQNVLFIAVALILMNIV
jgi:putative transport protein